MVARSNRLDVRNPITRLKAWEKLKKLPPEARVALREVLADLAAEAGPLAEKCWRTHKAPMATYWKGVKVYAGHIRRAVPA